jgi:Raf kinase inhibitor-like YbhB/YbcL family protein
MKRFGIGLVAKLTAAFSLAALPVEAAAPFAVTSSSFRDGGVIPLRNAGANAANPNCVGGNISPQFSWVNPPEGVRSYAIVLVNLEAREGLGVNNWIAYGIPSSITSLAEGEVNVVSPKFVGGMSSEKVPTYVGPCPPLGVGYHHYSFVVIATDFAPGELPPNLTREELLARLDGHAKASAGLVGLFKHP